MVPCVFVTMLLACVVLLKQSLGRLIGPPHGAQVSIITALPLAALIMLLLVRVAAKAREPRRRGGGGWCCGGGGSKPARARPWGADGGASGTVEVSLGELGGISRVEGHGGVC